MEELFKNSKGTKIDCGRARHMGKKRNSRLKTKIISVFRLQTTYDIRDWSWEAMTLLNIIFPWSCSRTHKLASSNGCCRAHFIFSTLFIFSLVFLIYLALSLSRSLLSFSHSLLSCSHPRPLPPLRALSMIRQTDDVKNAAKAWAIDGEAKR